MNEQDLKDALAEFFLKDFVVFFFLLYSLVYQSTDFINTVKHIAIFWLRIKVLFNSSYRLNFRNPSDKSFEMKTATSSEKERVNIF